MCVFLAIYFKDKVWGSYVQLITKFFDPLPQVSLDMIQTYPNSRLNQRILQTNHLLLASNTNSLWVSPLLMVQWYAPPKRPFQEDVQIMTNQANQEAEPEPKHTCGNFLETAILESENTPVVSDHPPIMLKFPWWCWSEGHQNCPQS